MKFFCFYVVREEKVIDRVLLTKKEAAAALEISVQTLELLIAVRELKSIRIGRRRMVAVTELERFSRRDHATRTEERAHVGA
jgi:excisionase family DNA binding protein